jgi:serine/threonine protein kinase
MKANRWKTVERVFNKSITLPPEKRREYVEYACGNDEILIEDVLSLLAEAEKSGNFLSEPLFEVGAKILGSELAGLFDEPNIATYEMIKILGRGGAGVVFLAKDTILERHVALKVLPTDLADDDERILRFQQEAKAASAISHPNVAHIYGFGKANSRYYLAMEYVCGRTLREMLKQNSIDRLTAIEIACQIAKALTAAHKAGIVHRDIKPENVIVTDDGLAKVLDFGLAKPFITSKEADNKTISPSLDTKPGMIIGTTAYMSPEQVRGQALDLRTDIWSLGVVLYEMLKGKRPFTGDTPSDVQALILLSEPEYGEEIAEIPELREILTKMLAKDVKKRYVQTKVLANDLEMIHKQLSSSDIENIHYSFSDTGLSADGFGENGRKEGLKIDDSGEESSSIYKNLGYILAGILLLIVITVLIRLFY